MYICMEISDSYLNTKEGAWVLQISYIYFFVIHTLFICIACLLEYPIKPGKYILTNTPVILLSFISPFFPRIFLLRYLLFIGHHYRI